MNGCDFYITIRTSGQMPEYYCQSGDFSVIETSATKAISKIYQNIFQNKTWYSSHIITEWNNKNIIDVLSSNINFCSFSCKFGEYEIFVYGLGLFTRSD